MTPKRGLGKGLDALFTESKKSQEDGGTGTQSKSSGLLAATKNVKANIEQEVPLSKLKANPDQPRKNFSEVELVELSDSIKEHGVIQPIIVEEDTDGTYIIVAGERRSRAAKIAGLKTIPAIIRKYTDEKRMIVALIENVQRSDLNPIEEAAAYKRLMELTGLSQDETALKVGKNRSTVANALRLLKLPSEMQLSIQEGELSPGHARAILSVSGVKNQELLYHEIMKKKLSVREAEKRAAFLNEHKKNPAEKPELKARAPELADMEDKFIKSLGTKVKIQGDENKGTIVIDYYSMDDLDRLYEILGR